MKKVVVLLMLSHINFGFGQNKVWDTFEGTRVLNNHSVEMLYKRQMEFIVAHKFGDLAGPDPVANWFGLDNLADVRLALEYGVTNDINVGLGRSKGIGSLRQVVDGYFKYRILQQDDKTPLGLTFVTSMGLPYGEPSTDSTAENSYSDFVERFIFTNQILASRKFSDKLSLQLNVGINHRNLVAHNDVNTLLFTGISGRYRFTSILGVLVEYNHIWNRNEGYEFEQPLSVGLELLTGGHAFTFIFSNGRGINENLFIPATTSSWLDGEFRLGFSITRKFKI